MRIFLKYMKCQWWFRHEWKPMESVIDGKVVWGHEAYTGCAKCDLWSYKPV